MTNLLIVVPSRARPESVAQMREAFARTSTADTQLIFAVDEDDPTIDDYVSAAVAPGGFTCGVGMVEDPSTMVHALNRAASSVAASFEAFAIGFMGDDHRPRTPGWDESYLQALKDLGSGVVYGDDLLAGERLPTQFAVTADIVRALGYIAPPTLKHMYVDNWWHDIGLAAGCLTYLPDVVVEHLHPLAGKSDWDEGYRRVNDPSMYARDREAYLEYQQERFTHDVGVIRELRGA